MTGTTRVEDFAGCDLVLEAVFEEMAIKKQVFAELRARRRRRVHPRDEHVVALRRRDGRRTVGAAFLQSGRGDAARRARPHRYTDDAKLATAWDVTKKLRKRAVLVGDAPAFVVNRVLTRMTSVLMDALEHGNTVEETDEAMLRLGLPMAPSLLLAMVGPRVANHVLVTLHDAYPDRFPLSPTLANYADGEATRSSSSRSGGATVAEITQDVLEAIADEIRHLLDGRRGRRPGRRRRLPDPRRRLALLPRRHHAVSATRRGPRSGSPAGLADVTAALASVSAFGWRRAALRI